MGIDHGCALALMPPPHLRPTAGAQGRRPRPPLPPGSLPPQRRYTQAGAGAGAAGDSVLGADVGGGIRGILDGGFLAIRLESCLIHAHGIFKDSPLWGQCSRSAAGTNLEDSQSQLDPTAGFCSWVVLRYSRRPGKRLISHFVL